MLVKVLPSPGSALVIMITRDSPTATLARQGFVDERPLDAAVMIGKLPILAVFGKITARPHRHGIESDPFRGSGGFRNLFDDRCRCIRL